MTRSKNNDNMDKDDDQGGFDYPDVVISETKSEPNSRSGSIKKKYFNQMYVSENELLRRNSVSVPVVNHAHSSNELASINNKRLFKRVRSFKLTTDGLLSDFNSFGKRKGSNSSTSSKFRSRFPSGASNDSACSLSCSSNCSTGYYRVSVMGANGVGKTTLKDRFMSSEYMSSLDFGIDDFDDKTLSIVVDNEESTLEFIDNTENQNDVSSLPIDAHVVVFSVHDSQSYDVALRYLQYLRHELDSDRPVIFVANKVDLVRKRQISASDAKQTAKEYNCKYIETSAVLNHKVDELLVGLLKQIKLKLNPDAIQRAALLSQKQLSRNVSCKGPKKLFNKLFRKNSRLISACENLFAL